MRRLLIAALALTACACSKSDNRHLRHDVNAVGADLKADARGVTNDPNIRAAGADLHAAAAKADADVRAAADKARDKHERDKANRGE